MLLSVQRWLRTLFQAGAASCAHTHAYLRLRCRFKSVFPAVRSNFIHFLKYENNSQQQQQARKHM